MTRLFALITGNPSVLLWIVLSTFVAGFGAGGSAAWYVQGIRIEKAEASLSKVEAAHVKYEAQVEKNAAASRLLALDKERFWLKEKSDAESWGKMQMEKHRVDLAAAVRTTDELRDTITTLREYLANASREAAVAAATATGELLESCAAEYRSVGAAAQGHAVDIETLIRAWPKT